MYLKKYLKGNKGKLIFVCIIIEKQLNEIYKLT